MSLFRYPMGQAYQIEQSPLMFKGLGSNPTTPVQILLLSMTSDALVLQDRGWDKGKNSGT